MIGEIRGQLYKNFMRSIVELVKKALNVKIGCENRTLKFNVEKGNQMSAKTYLWIADWIGKASYMFWTTVMHETCPEVIVESKMNNHELVKAVKGLTDRENRYIVNAPS